MNIAHYLRRAAHIFPKRPAVYAGAELAYDFATLYQRTSALAGALSKTLKTGDRVAIFAKNCPNYVEMLFACWQAGLVCVPINHKLHAREVAYILDHSGAKIVFTTTDLEETLIQGVHFMESLAKPIVINEASARYAELMGHHPIESHDTDKNDLAWLFYTSGTTGKPKGAMLTHENLHTMTVGVLAEINAVQKEEGILHAAPMSHGSGMYILPYVAAFAAQIIPNSGGFDPQEIAQLLRHHQGVLFFAAPTMVTRLLDADVMGAEELKGLKYIVYGGGPMYVADAKRAIGVLGKRLIQMYGQGESPMNITLLPHHIIEDHAHPDWETRLASVGYAHTSVELRIADDKDQSLPTGEVGEILVRGPSVMKGYWKNDKATQDTLRNGWLHTGDMGALDAQGFLTLKDRSKDVIISGGSNIYPREVEEVLLLHPDVAEVSVVGRKHADWGEEVVAVVALQGGKTLTNQDLDALCREHIARFKAPKDYIFVESLPKNSYGKILKTALRDLVG